MDGTAIGGSLSLAAATAIAASKPPDLRQQLPAQDSELTDTDAVVDKTRHLSDLAGSKSWRFLSRLFRRTDSPAAPTGSSTWKTLRTWGIPVTLGVLLVIGSYALRGEGASIQEFLDSVVESLPGSEESAAAIPVAEAPGRLVVDAIPWGQVTRIVAADGTEQDLESLDPDGLIYTPAVLSLPSGGYQVTVEHPATAPQTVAARVSPGLPQRLTVTLQEASYAAYLQDQGFQSLIANPESEIEAASR